MYTKMAMSVHYSYLRGPHTIFVLVRKWYGGRSISAPPIKKAPDFSEALGVLLSYLSSCCSMSATLILMRSRINSIRSSNTDTFDTLKMSLSR